MNVIETTVDEILKDYKAYEDAQCVVRIREVLRENNITLPNGLLFLFETLQDPMRAFILVAKCVELSIGEIKDKSGLNYHPFLEGGAPRQSI